MPRRPRVAIAHDYLTQRGGAERVVVSMLRAFPEATVHTLIYNPDTTFPEFRDATVVTSPINRVGAFRRDHRAALSVMPWAVSQMHIDADVVIASSSGWAHGMSTSGRKLVYCHAPARWLYQRDRYLGGSPARSAQGLALFAMQGWLTRWDRRAAGTADTYVVNSRDVQRRVAETYGIGAHVLPPPIGVDPSGERRPVPQVADRQPLRYHLLVSRLLPYKNVDRAVEAFRGLPDRLVIVGSGPLEEGLRTSLPDNVVLLTRMGDPEMRWLYDNATALVAPSYEDFGLTPIEAAAFGKPTLALKAGGYLDTVEEGVNGLFFTEPTAEAIRAAVVACGDHPIDPAAIRQHGEKFSEHRFHERLRDAVDRLQGSPAPLPPTSV